MRKIYVLSLLAAVFITRTARAQTNAAGEPVQVLPPLERPSAVVPNGEEEVRSVEVPEGRYDAIFFRERNRPMIWGGVEYLLWGLKSSVTVPPLVTLGNPANAVAGALGQPGTVVLFGGEQNYDTLNKGLRVSGGGWILGNWSWDTNGFVFERRGFGFAAGSDAAGNPALYLPFFRRDTGQPDSITVSEPFNPATGAGGFQGSVRVLSESRLWGTEVNLGYDLGEIGAWRLGLLGGFRYLDLHERLLIDTSIHDFIVDVRFSIQDAFTSHSKFYGGQLGFKASTALIERLTLDIGAKLALGSNYNVMIIGGSDADLSFDPPLVFNEGVYAQTSNIGRRAVHDFSVVPQVQFKIGYDVFPWMRATVGYDFVYWTRVLRAAEQIDPNIDISQSLAFNTTTPITTAVFPRPLFEVSNFWAHGLSLGLEFRY